MVNWDEIREQFPVTKNHIYFLSAGMSPLPRRVFDRIVSEYLKLNNHGDMYWRDDLDACQKLFEKIGKKIGTSPENITMVQSTSYAMSVVALSLKNNESQYFNIVSMMDEFPSTTVPFEYQNIEMRYVKPENARYSVDTILELADKNTRAVATSYVQYCTGFRQNLSKLGAELKKRGILLVVNATQAYPFFPVDVEKMSIDVFSASLHKWGFAGMVGTVFYTSPEFRKKYKAPLAGWLSVVPDEGDIMLTKKNHPLELFDSAAMYNLGSFNLQAAHGYAEAFDFLEEIGSEEIMKRIFELGDYLIRGLNKLKINIVSPCDSPEERSAIICFKVAGDNRMCVSYLDERKIHTAYRNGNVRVSLNIFNTFEEIDNLISALNQYIAP